MWTSEMTGASYWATIWYENHHMHSLRDAVGPWLAIKIARTLLSWHSHRAMRCYALGYAAVQGWSINGDSLNPCDHANDSVISVNRLVLARARQFSG